MNLSRSFKKGEVIFHEGCPSDYAYIIGTGSIEVLKSTPGGQKVLKILKNNEIFGEMGLIDGLPRSATARARKDSIVYILTPETFNNLAQKNPESLLPIMKILTSRLRYTMNCLNQG